MTKMFRQNLMLMLLLACSQAVTAVPRALTLDSCRILAADNNKDLRVADMERLSAHYSHKSAFTNYFPKISATGLYMRTGKEISLLSDGQKTTLPGLGDAFAMPALNSVGQGLVDALHTDTRNMAGTAVMLTQPVYMGGKIRSYDKITRYAEKIAADRRDLKYQELIVSIDETYWTIVALTARKRLAESYLNLVRTLDSDVGQMIDAGLATKAEGLSVKVKVNEANVAIIQVDNGIAVQKMLLCQLCGLDLDSPIELIDECRDNVEDAIMPQEKYTPAEISRPELSALGSSIRIYDEKIRIARAEFMPSVALTGGYFASYPSVFNSFEKKFKGTWYVGVTANIPIVTWGDRFYKVKSARAKAVAARLDFEETREKIELQVSQSRRRVTEAQEKYAAALSSQAEADENLRYATLGLKEGVIPVSDVIEAQTAWLSAKTCLETSRIDLQLAHVYLNKSLGTIK